MHLSIALGQPAPERGSRLRFYPVTGQVEQLEKACRAGFIDKKFRDVSKPSSAYP